jgi:type I restriction enzyme S subunit
LSPVGGGWPTVKLGDICEFRYGKALPADSRNGGDVGVYGSNGVVGRHDLSLSDGPTIVIGRKGSYGEINYSVGRCWPIDTAYFIDSSTTKQDVRWLSYRLAAMGLNAMNKSAAVPGLNREDAYRLELKLPPLSEQRRIAAILDQADALRAKRREALAQLDSLTQAIFIEMFGEPVANCMKWPELTFDQTLCDETSRATKTLQADYLDAGAIPVIDQGQKAVAGYVNEQAKLCPCELPVIVFGDHTRAVKLITFPFAVGADGAKVLVPKAGVSAVYVAHLLRLLPIPNLGYSRHMKELKRLLYPVPPIALQQTFAIRIQAVESLKVTHRAALAELDALFASLQHRAFAGQLS